MSTINTTNVLNTINGKQDQITSSSDLIVNTFTSADYLSTQNFYMKDSGYTNTYLTIENASDDSYRSFNSKGIGIYFNQRLSINTYYDPGYPLYVPSSSSSSYPTTGSVNTSFFNSTIALRYQNTNFTDVCARLAGKVVIGSKLAAGSDLRIKTNIQDINDDSALQLILVIKPKTYEYIDKIKNGNNKVYGFIAQQIKEVIPKAVILQPLEIPNIYNVATLSNSNVITLNRDISDIVKVNSNISLITSNMVKEEYKVTSVNSNQFTIETNITDNNNNNNSNIFVYGTKVDDFHMLEKSYIYTLNVCATQELYKLIQLQINKINELREKYENMSNIIQVQQEEINMIINNK